MPTWPTTGNFPQNVQYAGYQEDTPLSTIRTSMDIGPQKIRQRFTAAVRPFKVTLSLTTAQVATLDAFFLTTCSGGALSFTWNHPRTGAAGTFRFKQGIAYTREGNDLWTAKFEMEQLP